jgi:hypothetical protein
VQAADPQLSDSRFADLQPDPATRPAPQADGRAVVFGQDRGSTASPAARVGASRTSSSTTTSRSARDAGPHVGPPSRVTVGRQCRHGGAPLATEQLGIVVVFGAVAQVTGNVVGRAL